MPIPSSPFTQGGQTQIHKLRMLKQVVLSTFKIGIIGSLLGWSGYFFSKNAWINILMFPAYWWALLIFEAQKIVESLNGFCFFVGKGRLHSCSATWFLSNDYCYEFITYVSHHAVIGLYWAAGAFLFIGILVVTYFLKKGAELHETQRLSGFELTDLKGYKKFLKKNNIETTLTIENLPIPKDSESKHFMITGTTGSGKTNTIHHLLKQLRDRGDRVVIVDTTGGYISRFYEKEQDTILNPLDNRSVHWNLFLEAEKASDTLEMASFLVPKQSYQSEFWTQAARLMLCEGILATKRNFEIPSIQDLQSILLRQSFQSISKYFKDTNIASYFSGKSYETANSIRITLATSINFLESLEEEGEFSVKAWVKNETQKGWLFLSSDPGQRDYMQGLLTCWFSLAIKTVMSLGESEERRVWFVIDELASLHMMPSLQGSLAEIRKYGGCMVLGFQNIAQLESIYGSNITSSLSELTGTKLIFQCVDPKIATRMAEMLGQQEVLEASENVSFGANEIRDGVSLSHHKKLANLVKPTELLQLKPLECYVRGSLGAPILKTLFSYLSLERKSVGFISKEKSEQTTVEGEEENQEEGEDLAKDLSLGNMLLTETHDSSLELEDEMEISTDL